MIGDNSAPGDGEPCEPKIFAAVITPHRSLGSTSFLVLMLCVGGVSFAAGIFFLLLGAWPVFGFFGLDVLLIYIAFRANFRAARAYEEVTITATELTVRKVSHHGRISEWTLNPLWVRLDRVVHAEFGIERTAEAFPAQLEQLLKQQGVAAEVLSFAVSGYNTRQEVATLAGRGLAFHPDLVLLAYCLNDRQNDVVGTVVAPG